MSALSALVPLVSIFLPHSQDPASAVSARFPERTAFVGVDVLTMTAACPLPNRTVLVAGGRIIEIGGVDEVEVPAGFRRIDGRGRFLMPGLAEMHGHLPDATWPAGMEEDVLFLYLANGITTVRGMLGDPGQLELRERLERGELVGPRLFVGSPPLAGDGVRGPEQARALVAAHVAAGYDHLKVHEGLERETYDAIAAAAHEHGIGFSGHVSDLVGLRHAFKAGQVTVDHLDNYVRSLVPGDQDEPLDFVTIAERASVERLPEVVSWTKQADAAVVPTLVLWRTFLSGVPGDELLDEIEEVRYMPASIVERWRRQVNGQAASVAQAAGAAHRHLELRDAVLAALNAGNATILLGTDSPQIFSVPGFSIHREMAAMVGVGMTPFEVLRTGTYAVARHYGELDRAGTVAEGKRADLVLLRGNPLGDIARTRDIDGVMIGGRWISRDDIELRLARIEEACLER